MTIGIAIVLAMVLYLIDRNKVWKQAAKTAAVLTLLTVLGAAGFAGWVKYNDRQVAKELAAADVALKIKVAECVAKYKGHGRDEDIEAACKEHSEIPPPPEGFVLLPTTAVKTCVARNTPSDVFSDQEIETACHNDPDFWNPGVVPFQMEYCVKNRHVWNQKTQTCQDNSGRTMPPIPPGFEPIP